MFIGRHPDYTLFGEAHENMDAWIFIQGWRRRGEEEMREGKFYSKNRKLFYTYNKYKCKQIY